MDFDQFGIPLEEMARVWPKDSGLPMAVLIIGGDSLPHGPRIKVSTIYGGKVRPEALVSVTIEEHPKFVGKHSLTSQDKKQVVAFIHKNMQTLLDHYHEKISDKEALNALIPV